MKKKYITLDQMEKALADLQLVIMAGNLFNDTPIDMVALIKSFKETVNAFKILKEDVDYLHRANDELEEEVSGAFYNEKMDELERLINKGK